MVEIFDCQREIAFFLEPASGSLHGKIGVEANFPIWGDALGCISVFAIESDSDIVPAGFFEDICADKIVAADKDGPAFYKRQLKEIAGESICIFLKR